MNYSCSRGSDCAHDACPSESKNQMQLLALFSWPLATVAPIIVVVVAIDACGSGYVAFDGSGHCSARYDVNVS